MYIQAWSNVGNSLYYIITFHMIAVQHSFAQFGLSFLALDLVIMCLTMLVFLSKSMKLPFWQCQWLLRWGRRGASATKTRVLSRPGHGWLSKMKKWPPCQRNGDLYWRKVGKCRKIRSLQCFNWGPFILLVPFCSFEIRTPHTFCGDRSWRIGQHPTSPYQDRMRHHEKVDDLRAKKTKERLRFLCQYWMMSICIHVHMYIYIYIIYT